MNTGMRRNEILSCQPVRPSTGGTAPLLLNETKNGEARCMVPSRNHEAALDASKSLPSRIDGRLFPLHANQVSVAFMRAVRRASIEDFRLHDCRHTFASYQAMAGIQARGLQTLLGHRDGRMTARYSHLSDAYLKAAVDGVVLGRSNDAANVATIRTA